MDKRLPGGPAESAPSRLVSSRAETTEHARPTTWQALDFTAVMVGAAVQHKMGAGWMDGESASL